MASKIMQLTKGKVTIVDEEDYEYLSKYKWMFTKRGYAARSIRIDGKSTKISMHRVIMKAPPMQDVDHINGDPLDNRKSNLRFCTRQQNLWNKRILDNNKSGHKNVYWDTVAERWRVQVRRKYCGVFKDIDEAIKVAKNKRKELYGEYARDL